MMNKPKKITRALTAATCSLLGTAATVQAENAHEPGDWDANAAILYYDEPDRVTAVEPIIGVKYFVDTDETIALKLTLDSLTGASGSGAIPTDRPQTFTRPSGKGSYEVDAGETPLDDTFLDTRTAVNLAWDKPIKQDWRMNLGVNVSDEYDYFSIGVSSLFAHDFNQKNSTLSFGASVQADSIDPQGGIPTAFGVMQTTEGVQPRSDSTDDKLTVDFLLGLTQVINANSLLQVNYSLSLSDGYLTDPFKVISVVDSTTGRPLVEDTDSNLSRVVFENRPDSRLKNALYGLYKHYFNGDVLEVSYRFMLDDFGTDSHTIDLRYRWKFSETFYLQPHIRLYQQSAADFYTPFFIEGTEPTVGDTAREASADYRLGELNSYTFGVEFGRDTSKSSWSIAAEYYLQSGDEPGGKFGELKNQELFPDVDAFMVRIVYDF